VTAYTNDNGFYAPYFGGTGVWGNSSSAMNLVWNSYPNTNPNDGTTGPTGLWRLFHGYANARYVVTNGRLSASYAYVNDYRVGMCPRWINTRTATPVDMRTTPARATTAT
jgi:hypothetical protein